MAPYAGITRFNIADDRGNTYAFGDARIETTTTASGGVPGLTPVNTAWMLENLISQNRRDTVSFMYNTQSVNMPEADSEIYTVIDNVNNMLENDYIPSYSSAKTVSGFRIASAAYFHISEVDVNLDVIVNAIKASICNDDDKRVPNPTYFKQSGKDFPKNIGLKSMRESDDRSNKYVSIKDDGIQITFTPLRPADKPDKGFVNFKNSESFTVSLTASNQEIIKSL